MASEVEWRADRRPLPGCAPAGLLWGRFTSRRCQTLVLNGL